MNDDAEQIAGLNRILRLGFAVGFLCAYGFSAGESAQTLAKIVLKLRTQILLSAGLLAFAVIGGILFQWHPGNYLFLGLVTLQILFMVGFSLHETRWMRRVRQLPPEERARELRNLTPQQKRRFYEYQKKALG